MSLIKKFFNIYVHIYKYNFFEIYISNLYYIIYALTNEKLNLLKTIENLFSWNKIAVDTETEKLLRKVDRIGR